MCNIGMRALVPVKIGGVDDTLAIRNDWGRIHMPCPVETVAWSAEFMPSSLARVSPRVRKVLVIAATRRG